MKPTLLVTGLALAAALVSTPALATPTVLDMNSLSWGLSNSSQQTQGFVLSSQNGFAFVGNAGNCAPACAHNGSNYVWSGGATIGLQAADGSSFNLTQFEGAETHIGHAALWAGAIEVTGQYASGGSVSAQFVLDGVNDSTGVLDDFQRFFLPSSFSGLTSVSFKAAGDRYGQFALDNVVLNGSFQALSGNPAAQALPVPGSLPLALSALLLLAATLHLRRCLPQRLRPARDR